MVTVKDKDVAFLQSLIDNDGIATTTGIRKTSQSREDIKELSGGDINYRAKQKFNVDKSESHGWVECKDGGKKENGRDAPKDIILHDEESAKQLLRDNRDKYKDDNGNVGDMLFDLREEVKEIKEDKSELERENKELYEEIRNVKSTNEELRIKMNNGLKTILKIVDADEEDIEKLQRAMN